MKSPALAGSLVLLAMLASRAAAAPASSLWIPAPGAPVVVDGAIRWIARPETLAADVARWRTAVPRDGATRGEALAAWRRLAGHPRLGFAAWRRLAPLALATRDTALADSAWEALASRESPWSWEGTRGAVTLRLARGDSAGAAARLARGDSSSWSDAERGAWLEWRATLAEARGDLDAARALARRLLSEEGGTPAAARALERWGDALAGTPGFSFDRAADLEEGRGRFDAAAGWLARAPAAAGDSSARRALRRIALLRAAKRLDDAEREIAAGLVSWTGDLRATAMLERARVERDRGRADAFRWGDSAAVLARDPALRDTAAWEAARDAERGRRGDEARARYGRLADANGPRATPAALRAGWLALAAGDTAEAIHRFSQGRGEAATFWSGVARRAAGRPDGDSLLRVVAAFPGYGFHRTAARETLAIAGWPGTNPVLPARGHPLLELARDLAAAGLSLEAASLIERWRAGSSTASPAERARAMQLTYALGRTALAIEIARDAFESAGEAEAWSVAPWVYPPALVTLFATVPESGTTPRSLLRAVAWQESRFVPTARSRSRALGLFQLKLSTAVEVARSLRERRPNEAALYDPARSLRLGRRYLEQLVRHFGGHVPLAVAAYNAGPGSMRRARRNVAAGGDALELELLETSETWTYVRRILPAWQAYRELRPTTAP